MNWIFYALLAALFFWLAGRFISMDITKNYEPQFDVVRCVFYWFASLVSVLAGLVLLRLF